MIRKLIESDRVKLLDYLYIEGSLNIFIIGDVEAFGFEKDFQTLYGEFDKENNYLAVLLFYRENSIFYSHNRLFNLEWLEIYKNHEFKYLSGALNVYEKIIPYFKGYKVNPMFFAEAYELKEDIETTGYEIVKATSNDHFEKLFSILQTIDEFGITDNKQEFVDSKIKALKMGTTLFIEEDGIVLSTVATTAETTKSAMVVAVATLETARKRGLASILMKHLMNEYFTIKGKYLCLFYDNPKAGNIYKRLGFKDVDKWVMLTKE